MTGSKYYPIHGSGTFVIAKAPALDKLTFHVSAEVNGSTGAVLCPPQKVTMIGDASGAKQPIPLVLAGRTWEVGVSTGSIGGSRIQPTSVFLSETFTQAGVHGPPLKRTETLSLSFRGRTAKGEVGYDAGQCSVSFTATRR